MGFGDFLKNVGKAALDSAVEFGEKSNEYREKWEKFYSGMTNEQLLKERTKFKNGEIYGSQHEKAVRMSTLKHELQERGLIS